MTLLEVRGLSAGYGSLAAVRDLSLTVDAGEVVVLLGPNGAGKTTSLLAIAGELPPFGGSVLFDGKPFRGPLHQRARHGLAFVTEERSIFRQLTVQENLALGRGDPARAYSLAPELEPLRHRKAGLLSGGEQQILTLARALAGAPQLLLADEVSLGLAPLVAERMLRFIRSAADAGIGVLLVEQQAVRALGIADRGYVLNRGRLHFSGTAGDLRGELDRIAADVYLGDGGVDVAG